MASNRNRGFIMSVLTITMTVMVAVLVIMPTQLDAYYTQNTGCHHNGSWYADKSLVPTTEKCLNCQCNKKTLVCRLKVCPEMPMPPPRGCVVVQKKNTCCPYLSCARLDAFYKIPSTRRIIAYLDHYERESIDRVVNENMLQRRSDDTEVDLYVCVKNGTVYKSGSAMSSSNLCSYCYCIGGTEKCVKPKCMLPVEGCKPIFVDSTCCPVRYDCSTKQTGKSSQEVRYRKTSNKHYMRMSQRMQRNRGCTVGQQFYAEGQKMKSDKDKPCDICFCIRGQRKCAPKKCSPALRNCIPVVPKGQCCPSSYDCGSQRDYRRSQNSRQFNLFSLLFGKDEDQETAAGTQIAVEYPPDRHPEVVEKPFKPQTYVSDEDSKDKTIYDTIREGLELIDGNNNQMLKDNLDLIGIQPSPTPIPFGLLQRPISTTEVSFLDLILGSSGSSREENSSEETSLEPKTTPSGLSWVDILLAPDEEITASTTVSDKVDHALGVHDLTDFESSTSIDRLGHSDATESEENLGVLKADELDKIFITTPEEIGRTEPMEEDTTQTLPTTLIETTEEINATESIQSDLITTTSRPMRENLPSKTNNETIVITASKMPSIASKNNIHKDPKPEKDQGFLSVLLDGLSGILKSDNQTKNSSNSTNIWTKKLPGGNVTTSTISLPTPKPLPSFKPLPADKTYTRINSKIANLTVKPTIVSTKDLINTTFKPFPSTLNRNPIIPILKDVYPSSTVTADTTLTTSTISSNINTTISKSTKSTTSKPVVIKTNPTILEAESYDQNTEPTLPPSLPNLKIIPFLPTDAVKADHNKPAQFDFYHHNSDPASRVVYDLYDDANIYPSITEKYPIYPDLEDGSKAEYIYNFNVEGPDTSISSTAGKFDGTVGSPAFVKYDYTANGLQVPKGFSPPTKTEGGFMPKEPLILDDDSDNVSVKVGDSYQVTQHIIEIKTSDDMLNTTKVIEITTPDPFKDVIHTEPPPDLTSLIEDKLKNLMTQAVVSTNESNTENPTSHVQAKPFEIHLTNDSIPTMLVTNNIKNNEEKLDSVLKYISDNKQELKNNEETEKNPLQYEMSNATHDVKELYETIKTHGLHDTHDVSSIPPFKTLPETVLKQLDKEDTDQTTTQAASTKSIIPLPTSTTMIRTTTTTKISIPISTEKIRTTHKTSLVTTSKRPAIRQNNRNKTISSTTTKSASNKYGTQQQQQQPPAFTKNKQTENVADVSTATGTRVMSPTASYSSSLKAKGNATRGIANSKPTKQNIRPTNRPLLMATTSTHFANNPTKGTSKPNATNVERTSAPAHKQTVSEVSDNKSKTASPAKTAPFSTTTTTMATTRAATTKASNASRSSSSASWTTTSTSKSSPAVSKTKNPFLMSPFDKLPFMDASFELKRNSATPSFSASFQASQTSSPPIASSAILSYTPSFTTSLAPAYANHPKLMGLVHYKHKLNQLEGLEHSSQGTAKPLTSHYSTSSDIIDVSTSSASSAGNVLTKVPQAQHQQQQVSSPLNNFIDSTGILKLAGCNIYGRMYRVGRIIIELSTPCMECKCTEIGVKCGPLEC